jgi:thiamine biosynthesis lipoprotein
VSAGSAIFLGLVVTTGCGEVERSEFSVAVGVCEGRIEVTAVSARAADGLAAEIAEALRQTTVLLAAAPDRAPLAQVNRRAAEAPATVEDPELWRALTLALGHAQTTAGAFDPTLGPLLELHERANGTPGEAEINAALEQVGWERVTLYPEARALRFQVAGMRIDLAGFDSGYAIDVAARKFARAGSRGGVIRLCDVAYAWGPRPDGSTWPVALDSAGLHAVLPGVATIGEVSLSSRAAAIATRVEGMLADSEAQQHGANVLDRRTGRRASSDVLAAVVVADSAADAVALAQALLVAGSRAAGEMLTQRPRLEAVLLVQTRGKTRLLVSASLANSLVVDPRLRATVVDDVRYVLPPRSLR